MHAINLDSLQLLFCGLSAHESIMHGQHPPYHTNSSLPTLGTPLPGHALKSQAAVKTHVLDRTHYIPTHMLALDPLNLLYSGGPAGLASAIMFAKRGCKVTVAERNSDVTYSDPDRSYVYAIDGRGRQFTDQYDITPKLADASVSALDVNVTRVFPNGKSVSKRQVIKDEKRLMYWLPRSRCVLDL